MLCLQPDANTQTIVGAIACQLSALAEVDLKFSCFCFLADLRFGFDPSCYFVGGLFGGSILLEMLVVTWPHEQWR